MIADCGFQLAKGEKLLILGSTGAGKSTLVNLMLGLLEKRSGRIEVNGIPIEALDITALREIVAYVPQEPVLFSGTIQDNVRFAVPTPPIMSTDWL